MLNKSIIRKNLILSLSFGLLMGILFPIFASFFVSFNDSKSMYIFIIFCILAGVVVGVTAFLITRFTIIKVVMEIDCSMNSLLTAGHKNLKKIDIKSDDVIGRLVTNFNNFITSLDILSTSLENIVLRDKKISSFITNDRENLLVSEKKVIASIDNVTGLLNKNSCDIDATVDITKEIKQTASDLMGSISNQKSEVDSSALSISNILGLIVNLNDLVKAQVKMSGDISDIIITSTDKTKLTNSAINDLNEGVNKILDEINRINDLAEKTSTLAINASIEAARAGTSGKGFKIIAVEVRSLADSSKKYAAEITQDISEMSQNILDSLSLSGDNLDSLKKLSSYMSNYNSKQGEIISGIEEIKSNGDSINDGMSILKSKEADLVKLISDINSMAVKINSNMVENQDSTSMANRTTLSISNELKEYHSGSEEVYSLIKENEDELKRSEKELDIFTGV